jgi:pilus assembly protein CpaE
MSQDATVFAILIQQEHQAFVDQVATALGYSKAHTVIGTPLTAADYIAQNSLAPKYIIMDIGDRQSDVLDEIDRLAEHCTAETRVIAIGNTNDIELYRGLIQRGVIEYFTHPADIGRVREALTSSPNVQAAGQESHAQSKVITFMSAASGDGSSTIALNTAYCLAYHQKKSTIVVDMDYQFGMIARNLDLSSQFGIKDLFEHSDRSIDSTLIERMLIPYGETMKIMAAPNDLRIWPDISPDAISQLISALREKFDYVIIDLPHIWSAWLSTALTSADQNIIVAQLWLRSVTHTARLLGAWQNIGISNDDVYTIINRSGAKFKEAITARDYENVCRKKIDFYIANDIKTIAAAENEGKTIPEIGHSQLAKQFKELAATIAGESLNENSTQGNVSSLSSMFKK